CAARYPAKATHGLVFAVLLILIFGAGSAGAVPPSASGPDAGVARTVRALAPASSSTSTFYLPLVHRPQAFFEDSPIWAHAGPPAPHEVALFRNTFTLAELFADASLTIFADTRYEAWIDGAWVGRGPARFSRQTREYDTLAVGALAAGSH